MLWLPLPTAHRPATAATGHHHHSHGLPHDHHQPLSAGQGDTPLGWNHCKHLTILFLSSQHAFSLSGPCMRPAFHSASKHAAITAAVSKPNFTLNSLSLHVLHV